jgi:hypothetical protein
MEATCMCGTSFAGSTEIVEAALGRHQRRCAKAIPFIESPSIWDGPDDGSPEAFERWSQLVDMRLARSPDREQAERARAALVAAGREDLLPK